MDTLPAEVGVCASGRRCPRLDRGLPAAGRPGPARCATTWSSSLIAEAGLGPGLRRRVRSPARSPLAASCVIRGARGDFALAAIVATPAPDRGAARSARARRDRSPRSRGGSRARRPGAARSRSTGARRARVPLARRSRRGCPAELRERAVRGAGGVTMPLTLESWQADRRRACADGPAPPRVAVSPRSEQRRPAPPAVLELSSVHEEPSFVLAPGHDAGLLEAFSRLSGASAHRPAAATRAPSRDARPQPAALDPRRSLLCQGPRPLSRRARNLDGSRGAGDIAGDPRAARPRRRARCAVRGDRCHARTNVATWNLGGELKPFQRAGVATCSRSVARSWPTSRGSARRSRRSQRSRPTGLPGDRRLSGEAEAQLVRELDAGCPCAARGCSAARPLVGPMLRRRHGRQLRHRRRAPRQPRGTGAARRRARRVALLQEPGSEAHPGRRTPRAAVPRDGSSWRSPARPS